MAQTVTSIVTHASGRDIHGVRSSAHASSRLPSAVSCQGSQPSRQSHGCAATYAIRAATSLCNPPGVPGSSSAAMLSIANPCRMKAASSARSSQRPDRASTTLAASDGVTLVYSRLLDRWHGNAANREADEVVAIAEGAPRHARDARLAEQREDILARLELAPVIDGAAIIQIDLREEVIPL